MRNLNIFKCAIKKYIFSHYSSTNLFETHECSDSHSIYVYPNSKNSTHRKFKFQFRVGSNLTFTIGEREEKLPRCWYTFASTDTYKEHFLNIVKFNKMWIVNTLFRLICTKRNSVWWQINWKTVHEIQIWFDLTRFIRALSMCTVLRSYTSGWDSKSMYTKWKR